VAGISLAGLFSVQGIGAIPLLANRLKREDLFVWEGSSLDFLHSC
jgi:hypothetical protein